MKTKKIQISSVADVACFVSKASACAGRVTVKSDGYIINGKSLLGMYSLDLTTGVDVEFDESEEDFDNFTDRFELV